jgi:penicillin-insensitive murein endopeptidase
MIRRGRLRRAVDGIADMAQAVRRLARAAALAAVGLASLSLAGLEGNSMAASQLAKDLFGGKELPSAETAQSIGFYSKGCFAGGVGLPLDGPTWQVMRPSRNRNWGHPAMIALLERFSRDAVADGWNGLLVGDISQPRGGPMRTGHASHQVGLDADIWFGPMPSTPYSMAGREKIGAKSLLRPGTNNVLDERRWDPVYARLLKRAASYPEVERIFVNPGIKKKLCETVTGDRSWMNKIRPYWGHDEHFHVRIGCQPGSAGCKPQQGTGTGDGCDKSLAWWFTEEPWRPNENPDAPKARDLMTMASLPKQCQAVLDAPSPASFEAALFKGGEWNGRAPVAVAATPEPPPVPVVSRTAAPVAASAFAETPSMGVPLPRPRPGS